MKKLIGSLVFALAVPAFAADLSCPVGTKLVGGPKSAFEASLCMKAGADGSRTFHGPYVAYWPNGTVQAQGQYEEGWRSGTWTFFDAKGVKTGVTTFKQGDYDGLRVEFHANGMKKLEEQYTKGTRIGEVKSFDLTGKEITAVTK